MSQAEEEKPLELVYPEPLSDHDHVEEQPLVAGSKEQLISNTPFEYRVAIQLKLAMLAGWLILNLALTLFNKAIFLQFSAPWLITCVHATVTSAGCLVLALLGCFRLTPLSLRQNWILAAFSLLFTINIAISNVSLALVSAPFHQTVRSIGPIITIAIERVYFGRSYSSSAYLSSGVIVLGVALAAYGDLDFTLLGFNLTILGAFLASLKTVVTNRLLTGSLALPALELLLRMSPLAAVQSAIYALLTDEVSRVSTALTAGQVTHFLGLMILANGLLAFALNITSFQANKLAGALTITIAANIKQGFSVFLGVAIFHVPVGLCNSLGMLTTLAGAAWYSKVELDRKTAR